MGKLTTILSVLYKNKSVEQAKVKFLNYDRNKIISDFQSNHQDTEFALAYKLVEIGRSKPSEVYLIIDETINNLPFIMNLYDALASNTLDSILLSIGDVVPQYVFKNPNRFTQHGFLELWKLTMRIQPILKGKNKIHLFFFQGEKTREGYK